MTRARLEAMQRLWNSLVDEYISEGTDARPRQEIERAAKIGPGNGALIRVCEAADCNKVEKIDVDILKKCSKCKIVSLPLSPSRVVAEISPSLYIVARSVRLLRGKITKRFAARTTRESNVCPRRHGHLNMRKANWSARPFMLYYKCQ